ncbi:WG repeat-containing protein [Sutterella megalosphaeroides]|uniref:WG repeat-containing protein n=1 Tax=Sutterella megalosphaeroides TaxID=2494234 RepID=A0A2Z6IBY9_9BURK|nr:WG repeat-containing protein [Sutterella megalosphaeroides]BBF23812.1 hypothetical protein SUTMEG_17030 [Sutterella megalosphaeroides]
MRAACPRTLLRSAAVLFPAAALLAGCAAEPQELRVMRYDNGPDIPSEGLVRVLDGAGRLGYADASGRVVIAPRFAFGYPFREGRALVTFEGREEAVPGSGGELHVWKSPTWFCIDTSGSPAACPKTRASDAGRIPDPIPEVGTDVEDRP